MAAKDSQLQIRVTQQQKATIKLSAERAGKDVSQWVLDHLGLDEQSKFQKLTAAVERANGSSHSLAALNDYLSALGGKDFVSAIKNAPEAKLQPDELAYIAAMVEHAAFIKGIIAPAWVSQVPALNEPMFGSELQSVRMHLLLNSPLAFRRRNIFIDSSIGDRV